MLRLLIVDDSALMRRQLVALFEAAGSFEVKVARNGEEAVNLNREFKPDVVTLDINMPEMDGLTALSLIMAERPVAIVMFSSLTDKGALATFEALNLGALDYVAKPGGTISLSIDAVKKDLVAKVRSAARARLKAPAIASARVRQPIARAVPERPAPKPLAPRQPGNAASRVAARPKSASQTGIVIIGVSTGGPRTLEEVLPGLSEDFPWPVLVAQHMPAAFTKSFAERLNIICPLSVVEAGHPMPLEPGTIYLGKGGADMLISTRIGKTMVVPKPENPDMLWHPSVELLGRTALAHYRAEQIIGVMLTGMGSDGADSFAEIRRRGGRTIAESEDSAVIFGMPKELIDRGGASLTLRAGAVATQVNLWAGN